SGRSPCGVEELSAAALKCRRRPPTKTPSFSRAQGFADGSLIWQSGSGQERPALSRVHATPLLSTWARAGRSRGMKALSSGDVKHELGLPQEASNIFCLH